MPGQSTFAAVAASLIDAGGLTPNAALARRQHLDVIARAGGAVPAQLAAEVERDVRTAEAALVRAGVAA